MNQYDLLNLSKPDSLTAVPLCLECRALVWDRPLHDQWHASLPQPTSAGDEELTSDVGAVFADWDSRDARQASEDRLRVAIIEVLIDKLSSWPALELANAILAQHEVQRLLVVPARITRFANECEWEHYMPDLAERLRALVLETDADRPDFETDR